MTTNQESVGKWTAGPWSVTDRGDLLRIREEASDAVIATTDDGGHPDETIFDHEQQLANARLIAAAPEMAEALQQGVVAILATNPMDRTEAEQVFLDRAQALLAKINGAS